MECDDETALGAKNRRKLEKIGRQTHYERECPYCGETKVYYAIWDKPICPQCGAELPKIKNKKIKGGNGNE